MIFILVFFFGFQDAFAVSGPKGNDLENQIFENIQAKKRWKALDLIQQVYKSEKKNPAKQILSLKAQEVAELFFFDKAQQKYESAMSLTVSDPSSVPSELEQAKKLEPDNLKIDLAIVRMHLANKDCLMATEGLKKWLDYAELIELIALAKAQINLCAGNITLSYSQGSGIFWLNVELERLLKNGLYARAFELANQAIQIDSKFPESYYWLWKAESAMKTKAEFNASKYISLCKGLTSRQRTRYQAEPNLCLRVTEVETAAKKFNN